MKRWLKRFFVIFLVVVLVGGATNMMNRYLQEQHGLDQVRAAVAELDGQGEPWQWYDLLEPLRKTLPNDANTAMLAAEMDVAIRLEPRFDVHPVTAFYLIHDDLQHVQNYRLHPETSVVIDWAMSTFAKHTEQVRRIRLAQGSYRFVAMERLPIVYMAPHSRGYMRFLVVMSAQRWLDLERGDFTAVETSLLDQLKFLKQIGEEPTERIQIIRMAGCKMFCLDLERLLAQHELDEATLLRFQQLLDEESRYPSFHRAILGERAIYHHHLTRFLDNTYSPRVIRDVWDQFNQWELRPYVPLNHAEYLRYMKACLELEKYPEWERLGQLRTIPRSPHDPKLGITNFLIADVEALLIQALTQLAHNRCTIVALACERFRLRHKRWPESLEELIPSELSEVPLDPFSGTPIRCRHFDDRLGIYSVGNDGQDDDCTLFRKTTIGFNERDLGTWIYSPDHRRLDALPPIEECIPVPPHEITMPTGDQP